MGRLQGKSAIITGGARGIGFATAKRFIEEGADVLITDLNSETGETAARELGDKARFLAQDVTDEDSWPKVIDAVVAAFGKLDILVNNAGILSTAKRQNIENTDLDQWRTVQAVNVEGVFLGCRAAIGVMKENGGSIVNLSSVAALEGTPQLAAYGASKAAVMQLTKSIAVDCGRRGYGIRCNSVHPDPIRTDMGDSLMAMRKGSVEANWDVFQEFSPLGHLGEPIDVANCILFLASDEARHVTGSQLVVDGGLTAG
jgi:3(or 17)beta-hydroxysteroid dehydrogenase